jgi:hypothetical protein
MKTAAVGPLEMSCFYREYREKAFRGTVQC